MKKLFIINAQPGGNKGAEAMLETVISNLKDVNYQIYIEALNDGIAYERFINRMPVDIKLARFRPKSFLNPYDVNISESDVVIDIGGINYHDKSLKANLRNLIRHSTFIRHKAKLIFFTQDFGPACKYTTKIIAKYIYQNSALIFMRSTQSKVFMESLIGSQDKIYGPYPDCTLKLNPSANSPTNELPKNYIVLAPSAIMFNEFGEEYLNEFVDVALGYNENCTSLVLVHNFTSNGNTSDLKVSEALHKKILEKGGNSFLFSKELDPSEFKYILKESILSVTSRYHVLVGSMSSGTPSFAIGWSHKYKEFMSLYGMEDKIIQYSKGFSKELNTKIGKIILEGENLENIATTNLELKDRVMNSYSELLKIL